MVRKPSDHPVASLLNVLGIWLGRTEEQTAPRRSVSGKTRRRLGYESLEHRALLSVNPGAVVQGTVYNDLNGQGQLIDGPGVSGVTVKLWEDGGDGKFEGSAAGTDDTLVGTQQTTSSGGYSFSVQTAGTYFVQEFLPTGYVAPVGADVVSTQVNGSQVQTIVDTVSVSSTTLEGAPGPSIDSFTTKQAVSASNLTTSSQALTTAASEAIGGYRSQSVVLTSSSGEVDLYSNEYTPNVLEFDLSSTAVGSGTVTWDGNSVASPTTLNPTGLNHADLTGGGTSTGITLDIGRDDDPTSFTLTVYKDATDWSSVTEAVPTTGGTATQPLYIPFSSFTVGGGTGAGSFNNVGAIQLQITGDSGAHTEISSIGAVGPGQINANFANYQPASVGTFAFWDLNSNGVRDTSETGAANVAVQLLQNGSVVANTTTNAQGNYSFTGLAPGAYSVKFVTANGSLFTTEGVGSNAAVNSDANPSTGITPTFSLTSGENLTTVDAGLLPIALSIVKSVDNSTPNIGTNVNFTITLSNSTGVSPATGVTVSDVLPAGLTFVSDTAAQGSYSNSTGVWTVGNLASGASTSLTITATVVGSSAITNIVQVTGADEADSSPASKLQSSATVTPVQPADLELTKTVNNATPNVGQNVVFTQTITNLGPGPATGVTTTDLLPAGLTYVSSTASEGSYNNATGVWTVGAVADGSAPTLQITATVATPGTKTNIATISHEDQPDPNPNNNTGTAIVTPQQADLSITKSVNNATPNVGQNATFTITVSNAGPSTGTDVVATDILPAGLTFVSDTTSQGTYNSSTGAWTIGTLASGATPVTLTLTADVTTPGAKTNTATVTGDQYDPNLSNNTASATVTPPQADLSITKSVNNPTPNVGQNATFTITVSNSGPSTATDVVSTDVLPAGLTFVSDTTSQGTYNSSTGLWTIGTLASGATPVTLTLVADVTTPGAKTNTATVTGDQYDPNLSNNTASATVTPPQSDLSITKSVNNPTPNVGQNATFTITVDNLGTSTATNVVSTDVLPAGLTFVTDTTSQGSYNSGTGLWTIGTLPVGTPVTLSLVATVATPGAKTNTATVTGDQYDPNLANNTASATVTPATQIDLTVTKTVDNPIPAVGSVVHFTITVSNAVNESTATDVLVHDLLPAGLVFDSATPAQGTYSAGTGVWTVGSLASGATTSIVITATVTTTGVKTNVATVTADQPDPNGVTTATAIVNPLPNTTTAIPPAAPAAPPAVRLSKVFFLSHYTG